MLTSIIKRLFCAAELAELDRLRYELSQAESELRLAELTAGRLAQEKEELLYQLNGERKKVRKLRKRTRRG